MSKLILSTNRVQNEGNNINELDFDADIQYIKGLYDAFRFVGGEIHDQDNPRNQTVSDDTSKMLHAIKSFTQSKQLEDVSELKLDLLTMQDTLAKTNLKLKSFNKQLHVKNDEIHRLRHDLEQKNIILEQKNRQIANLNEEQAWNLHKPWNNTANTKVELKESKENLKEAREEIKVLRHELEQRNISIDGQIKKSIFFQ